MKKCNHLKTYFLLFLVFMGLQNYQTFAQLSNKERDGQKDFDFEIGTWKTHLKRLLNPLTGSNDWVEYEGEQPLCEKFGVDAQILLNSMSKARLVASKR